MSNQSDAPEASTTFQLPHIQRNARLQQPLPARPSSTRIDSVERKRRLTEQGRVVSNQGPGRYRYIDQRHEDLAARILPQFRPTMDLPASIPLWQPDEDVQKCPVCNQDFTLFFRKHHCRKCGKVVCGECSRHRITMPLRYIVQPPWTETASAYPGASSAVRVCNPCVPDPWTPANDGSDERPQSSHRYSLPPPPPPPFHHNHQQRHSTDMTAPGFARPHPRMDSQHPAFAHLRRPLPPTPQDRLPVPPPTTRPPRREVKEEDECPVCGVELPPGEALREVHIAGCINTRFGSPDTRPAETPIEASSSSPVILNRIRAQSYRSRGLYQYKATEKDCTDGEGQEQECPICFEEFQPGETLGRLECLCRFHHKCIGEWWVRRGPGMCPVHASHE